MRIPRKVYREYIMDEKKEKSKKIVKSIKLLEGVLKSTSDAQQRSRVKKDLDKLRKMLKELYPGVDIETLEEAIFSDSMIKTHGDESGLHSFKYLKDVEVPQISHMKDDREVGLAAGILKHFEDRVWGILSDQHTKLDFSNSGVRDSLYRKLDICNRSLKLFNQTISDIERSKSMDHASQLNLMKMKQGRIFLYDALEFFKDTRDFVGSLIADAEFGGSMVLNYSEKVEYADYEKYRTFEDWILLDALKHLKEFLDETLDIIRLPDLKKI